MGVLSLKASDRLVLRFGVRRTFVAGLSLAALSLLLFARAPMHGHYAVDVLPGMLLLGLGGGVAFNPLLLAAMGDVDPSDTGLASGVMNTAFMMGGALGLGVLASIAAARTAGLTATGSAPVAAMYGGYTLAFACGGAAAVAAAVLGGVLLRQPRAGEPMPAPRERRC
jgi:MFS family permease